MPVPVVWILGHYFVFRGALRAAVKPDGRQLGLTREEVLVWWLGKRGMMWSGVLPEFYHFVRLDRPLDVLVLMWVGTI